MVGTFGSALEARHVNASDGTLTADARGEIAAEGKVLMIRSIHVRLRLKTSMQHVQTALRVHEMDADSCPIYRTLKSAIRISSELITEHP